VFDEVAGGDLLHLLLVDRGLVGEVEALQGFTNGKRAMAVRMVTFLEVLAAT
jgi:hypothetical protein